LPLLLVHGSILSRVGASGKPGAVQVSVNVTVRVIVDETAPSSHFYATVHSVEVLP